MAAARTRSQIEETAELVRTKGRRCLAVPTDITDPASLQAMVDAAIAEFGRIDILLNNAGGATEGMGKPVEQVTDQEWRTGIDTNLSGTFYCCRAAIHQPSCGQAATVTALADGVARSRADLHSVPVKARLLGGNSRLL